MAILPPQKRQYMFTKSLKFLHSKAESSSEHLPRFSSIVLFCTQSFGMDREGAYVRAVAFARRKAQAAQAYTAKLAKRRHYKTLYWEFTRFSKILEYCYYCGNKFYTPSVHRILVCCVHFGRNLRSFRQERRELFFRINYAEGWFLHTPFASRSQSHANKIFSGAIVLPQTPQNQHIHKVQ